MPRRPWGSGQTTCTQCGGQGSVNVPKRDKKTGVRHLVRERCKRCKGTGWVGTKPRLR
jgi:DnaJ-class molecular chaperone